MFDYKKRLVEVDEVLNYLSAEDLLKIPVKVRLLIKQNKDKDYKWKYDVTKPLKDQDLNRDTIALLSYLNMEYILSDDQKKIMTDIHKLNDTKDSNENISTNVSNANNISNMKYDRDKVFENNFSNHSNSDNNTIKNNNAEEYNKLISYRESFFTKIIKKIKAFFFI